MTMRLGVVMDPIASIHYHKDTTLALLVEAEQRGWTLYYFEPADLWLQDGEVHGRARLLTVAYNEQQWFAFQGEEYIPLSQLDILLMRKDPPFNEEYIHTTYLLDYAAEAGVSVINHPQALRDCNEKLFATWFSSFMAPTVVTQSIDILRLFWEAHGDIVCKPLNNMGGASVFRLQPEDPNAHVVFETLTRQGTYFAMAQQFIPAIQQGDKRILMIDGEPYPYALARVPQAGDWRGNLAVGAKGVAQPLTTRDQEICAAVGPELRRRGLYFVGLDVIGDYLTEINVTSPTCVRELDAALNTRISAHVLDVIAQLRANA